MPLWKEALLLVVEPHWLRAANALTVKGSNPDQEACINIVRCTLQAPSYAKLQAMPVKKQR